jgi:DNA-binding SARP family transcriptional activator/ActR/RegA family two-component response regulator
MRLKDYINPALALARIIHRYYKLQPIQVNKKAIMDIKRHILIVEGQEEWMGILRQAIPRDEFVVRSARNYDEAVLALEAQNFALAIVDPVLDSPVSNHRETTPKSYDGLQLLTRLAFNYPQTRLVVVSGSVGREMLRNAPELPRNLPLVLKQNWDKAEFWRIVTRTLAGEDWGPPEPDIQPPTEAEIPVHMRYAGLTGPLPSTGFTAPLKTGLLPPPVGSRPGKPRVLIVESRPDWQHKMAKLMESEEFFWRVAGDYEQAMERLRLESFHVVVLDLTLGGADVPLTERHGWQLLDFLVNHHPKTKVMVSSGEASRSDVAKLFMRYPIKGFVDKEAFNEAELLGAIREQLAGPSLRIQTLGDFRVWRNGTPITDFGDENAERLIKILVTRRGENVSVEEMIECLWPGAEAKTHSATLGTTISSARTALEPDLPRPNDSNFILRNGANYLFNFLANVEVDAEQLRLLVSEGRQHERREESAEALKDYEAARLIYQGDYLPTERSERWAIQERSALQALYTDALNRIADLYADTGNLDRAIEAASRSLQIDSYNESTYRRLMRYHTCKGNPNAAKSVYRALVKLFSEFFGEEPGPTTQNLYEDINEGRPVACVESSTPTTADRRVTAE